MRWAGSAFRAGRSGAWTEWNGSRARIPRSRNWTTKRTTRGRHKLGRCRARNTVRIFGRALRTDVDRALAVRAEAGIPTSFTGAFDLSDCKRHLLVRWLRRGQLLQDREGLWP